MHGRDQNLKKDILIKPKEMEELCIESTRMGEMPYTKLSSFLLKTNDIDKVKYK